MFRQERGEIRLRTEEIDREEVKYEYRERYNSDKTERSCDLTEWESSEL